jgi:hypothetical protein
MVNENEIEHLLQTYVTTSEAPIGDRLVEALSAMVPPIAHRFYDRGLADELVDKTAYTALREAVLSSKSHDLAAVRNNIRRTIIQRLRECFSREGHIVRLSPSGRLLMPPL